MTDERDARRMAAAIKADDSFFATYLVSSYSPAIVRWAAARRITPNQVTATSALLVLCAAASFATGERVGLIIGALLVQPAFVADCVDGQLARYTATTSRTGAWLDAVSDRIEESVLYAGLAIGGARAGVADVWLLATFALALLALRHQAMFGYATQYAAGGTDVRPDSAVGENAARRASASGIRAAGTLERTWLKWIKRTITLPIGERFALISVTAAFGGPRVTFLALLAWGGLAAVYATSGRVLRALTDARVVDTTAPDRRRPPVDATGVTALLDSLRDDGPLARALRRAVPRGTPGASTVLLAGGVLAVGLVRGGPAATVSAGLFVLLGAVAGARRDAGRFRWIVAPLLHAGEYATLMVLASRAGGPPAAFALLAVVTTHHYVLYYLRHVDRPPRSLPLLAGGWDGRTLVLTLAAPAGVFAPAAAALALWCGLLLGASALQRARALQRQDDGG